MEGWWAASAVSPAWHAELGCGPPRRLAFNGSCFGAVDSRLKLCAEAVSVDSQGCRREGDSGGSLERSSLVSRGVSIAVHVPRRQWPNANRRGFRRPLAISLDSVSLPAVRFLVAHAAAAWGLLLFPRSLCAQIMHSVGHFHCHSCREADAAVRVGKRYPGQSAALGAGSAPPLGTCGEMTTCAPISKTGC